MDSKKHKIDGFLQVLSYESTGKCQALLSKHGQPKAKDHADLQNKLAELFKNTDDKIALEKEMCEIHPHRNVILKYSKSPEKEESKVTSPNGIVLTEDSVRQIMKEYISSPKDSYSNCAGNPNCNCGNSSFSGNMPSERQTIKIDPLALVGLIGVVAIVGILVIYKK